MIFVGCEGDEPALSTAIKLVGSDPFLFSSDFPHEVNNETCKKEIEEITENEDISEASKEAILYKNAQRFYRLT